MTEAKRAELTRTLNLSFMTHDKHKISIPKTTQVALTLVAAYLQATQPLDGDPNIELHHQQIRSLNLAGGALIARTINLKEIETAVAW